MKVLISDAIDARGVKMLADAGIQADVKTTLKPAELKACIGEYDALVIRSATRVTAEIIEAAKKLKIIGRAGVGVDNVDLPSATKNGVIVVNSPQGNTIAAAEHTWAMIMCMARHIPQAFAKLKVKGIWDRKFMGVELHGKTLGILGFGNIGRNVSKFALATGMQVIVYDPFVKPDAALKLGVDVADMDTVLAKADVITLHLPVTPETRKMINGPLIAKMKKGVLLVNVARGEVVDDDALVEALKSGHIRAAALDVFSKEPLPKDSPYLALDNVILTPHLGASTAEAQTKVAVDVVDQVIEVLKGGPARTAVNIPSMSPELLTPIKQFIDISERLGSIVGQLGKKGVARIIIEYSGKVAKCNTSPLSTIVLKGVLDAITTPGSVNFVNAPLIAKEKGIEVISVVTPAREYGNLITVKGIGGIGGLIEVAGTYTEGFGEQLVSVNGFRLSCSPHGYMLFVTNKDEPGRIGEMGTFLGERGINIASLDVGRVTKGGMTTMVMDIDQVVSEAVIAELCAKCPTVVSAALVKLPPLKKHAKL